MTSPKDFTALLKPHPNADGAKILGDERSRSNISVQQLSLHLFGAQYLERQERILAIVLKHRIFSKSNQANMSRPNRYKLGLARGKRMRQLMDEHSWDDDDLLMAEYLIDDIQPYHLHMSLFTSAMREQSSDEQRLEWMPKIASWEVVGAYAQTELGHGSNVRALELTATWDNARKTFDLHSPTLTASKWWNGTLGRTATHSVVIAQLLLPEGPNGPLRSHGPHPFIVRVRDEKTHLPPKSIVVGDIGPKYGYAMMDNAYMLFDHHQVPHSALLCRYASIDPVSGIYTKPNNPSFIYGSLVRGRSIIVMNARLILARAVTVAVRYLAIRRQFRDRDASVSVGQEMCVLDYPTVQIRVLPLLATAFALHYSGAAMKALYERTRSTNALDGDRAQLAELHSTSAGLKSLATELAANGIETCRRAMGGHGYGGGTGLVQLNADYLSKPTVEGDNWMITQQVARSLIKKVGEVIASPDRQIASSTDACLSSFHKSQGSGKDTISILNNDLAIVKAFEHRMAWMAFRAHRLREIEKRSWNSLLIDFHKLSRAYSQCILVTSFYNALKTDEVPSGSTRAVLSNLFRLFAFATLDADAREFQQSGAVAASDLDVLQDQILELMGQVRPHAVRLVDAFAIPDYLLDSALGKYDGKVYEQLFYNAHVLNPLNRITFNPDYRTDEIVMGSGDGGAILAKL
ncbi:hypothetical protein LTR17_018630 [Elasticomyces elasticus]|nr:hypothetical protein LTR17_018630 [Elasticomyces elasticus]